MMSLLMEMCSSCRTLCTSIFDIVVVAPLKSCLNELIIKNDIITPLLIMIVFSLLLIMSIVKRNAHSKLLPLNGRQLPGPSGIPILGYLPMFTSDTIDVVSTLKDRYGDIFAVPVGRQNIIFLNSYDIIYEALVHQQGRFSGRFTVNKTSDGLGDKSIVFTDGRMWRDYRRLVLRALRDYGRGQARSEEIILQQAEYLRYDLITQSGRSQNSGSIFRESISKVLSIITFGFTFDDHHPENLEFLNNLLRWLNSCGLSTALPLVVTIFLSNALVFSPIKWYIKWNRHLKWCHDFIKRKVMAHCTLLRNMTSDDLLEKTSSSTSMHNLCEKILVEESRRDFFPSYLFSAETRIYRSLIELFIAGTDTIAVTLCWACVLLSFYSDVQEKVHQEIDTVIGQRRSPQMTDKLSCHYINAVLDEILRFSSIMPFALPHRTTKDSLIRDFFIPKESIVLPNLYAVHHDPQLWKNPNEFQPDRFLDRMGDHYVPSEHLIAFGLGERTCIGKSLAKMELFLFFTVLLQRLQVRLEKPHPPREVMFAGNNGIIRYLCEHRVIFQKRLIDEDF